MDLNKHYNNPKLELRRKQLIHTEKAVANMRRHKQKNVNARLEVRLAMTGRFNGPVSTAIVHGLFSKKPVPGLRREPAFRLLRVVADQSNLLDAEHYYHYVPGLLRLAQLRDWWIRKPDSWRPHTHNVARQFASLLRHLMASYPVPSWMDSAWLRGHRDEDTQDWFLHVGRGGNLRTAPKLPIPLTKMMAHHAVHAPTDLSATEALRYGQARGMNVSERIALAVAGSRLGQSFVESEQEAFWTSVLNFLSLHAMIDPVQVGPIIDYLHNQKFESQPAVWVNGNFVDQGPPQPGLSMHRRDPVALMRQVDTWHHQLSRRRFNNHYEWTTCGIPGYDRIEGEPGHQRRFTVTELLNSSDLRAEGSAMRHCVATYGHSCKSGRVAIYSMVRHQDGNQERMLTVEVNVRNRLVTQARGKFNAASTPLDQRILNAWATTAKLKLTKYTLSRAY